MWTIWFQDGQGRELISSEEELRAMAARFDFDANEVLRNGGADFTDADGDIVGGIYEEEEEEESDWFLNDVSWEDYYYNNKRA